MFSRPMRSRRLFWRQFLSAFNDNFVRRMLARPVPVRGRGRRRENLAAGRHVPVLPSIPLKSIGGSTTLILPAGWLTSASPITAPGAGAALTLS
jgi:hypothetical protein